MYNSAHAFLYKSMVGTTEHKWYEICREALLIEALIAKSELQCTIFVLSNIKDFKNFTKHGGCVFVTVIIMTS